MAETMSEAAILAGARWYARASAVRAMHGVVPEPDAAADAANWRKTRPDIRASCIDMVRGIVTAARITRP